MSDVTRSNFGLLIAYILPGFTLLWGLREISPTIQQWLGSSPQDAPSIAGFLYGTLASVGTGLTISTLRWLIIDTIHHRTGVRSPNWNFAGLRNSVAGYEVLNEIHYRYYQFYANMVVALVLTWIVGRIADIAPATEWLDAGYVILIAAFFAGSRDTLRKYYVRTTQLFSEVDRPAERKKPAAKNADESRHQVANRHPKGDSELLDVEERDVPFTALNAADVGPM